MNILAWYVRNVSSLFTIISVTINIHYYCDLIFLNCRTYEEKRSVYDVSYSYLYRCKEKVRDITFNVLHSQDIRNF